MSQEHRKNQIVQMVASMGFVSISELVELFKVTPQTIRKDLNELAKDGKLTRHHGGAGIGSSTVNTNYSTRVNHGHTDKETIAQLLANDIPDGSSLFVNIGTSTEAVARALSKKRDLRVLTNNLHVASIFSENKNSTIIIAGGEVRQEDGGIIGGATVDLIRQFQMDYAIIGVSGISSEGTLLDFDYREVRVTQAIIQNSRKVLLCADHSKFGRSAMVRLGTLDDIDDLYTNKKPSGPYCRLLEEANVGVHYPELHD